MNEDTEPMTEEEKAQWCAQMEALTADDDFEGPTEEEIAAAIEEHARQIAEEEAEEAERAANAPTDEEIEAMMASRDYHMEQLQYLDWTHTKKDDALLHKKLANPKHRKSSEDPAFHTTFFSFDHLVALHRNGMTFRRLPYKADDAETETQFLFMDIDDDKIPSFANHITETELETILEAEFPGNWTITPSTSRTPYNYHVFIFLTQPIPCTLKSYEKKHDQVETALCKRFRDLRHIPAGTKHFYITDPAGRSPMQTFYGCSQPDEHKITLMATEIDDDTGRFVYREPAAHLERSEKRPTPLPANVSYSSMPYTLSEWKARTVPTNPTNLVRLLQEAGDIESGKIEMQYAFKAWLPYMKKGATKGSSSIPIGERNNRITLFGLQLYNVFRATNLFLSQHDITPFTQEELVTSFGDYISRAYQESFDFNIHQYLAWFKNYAKFYDSRYSDAEWCEKWAKYAIRRGRRKNLLEDDRPLKTGFRTKDFCREETAKILKKFTTGDHIATFNTRAELLDVLKEYDVSPKTFDKHKNDMGYTVKFKVGPGGSRQGSGRRPTISLDDILKRIHGKVNGDTVTYTGTLEAKDRLWLSRQDFHVKHVVS